MFDVLGMGPELTIDGFHGIGVRQRVAQKAWKTQTMDGEGLGEPFPEAPGGAGMVPLPLVGQGF